MSNVDEDREFEKRSRFYGVAQIIRFNWPMYLIGTITLLLGVGAAMAPSFPSAVRWLAAIGTGVAGWWLLGALVASWWIYDLSPLTRWRWLRDCLGRSASEGRIVNIHAGFDDTTLLLRKVFSRATVEVLDLYDPKTMTEPSIHRARRFHPPLAETIAAKWNQLPFEDKSIDAVCLLMAAHELRSPSDRDALFNELRRILKPLGRVVLVEHVRDLANFIVFGPGFTHFWPILEWRRLAAHAGLSVVKAGRVTPFVRYLVEELPA